MQFFEKITTEQENKEIMCIPNEFLTCRRRKCVEKGVTTDREEMKKQEAGEEDHGHFACPQILTRTSGKRLVSNVDACAPPPASQLGEKRSSDSHPWGIPQGMVTTALGFTRSWLTLV